ncbi:MAG: hypothetical protein Q9185_006391 [Variospora sp. 1 TL-2023]
MADGGQKEAQIVHLRNLLQTAHPYALERAVEEGLKLLDSLKSRIQRSLADNPDAEELSKQIECLRKQGTKTKTIIGVVGATGAGKSSIINAVLNLERLVPTNGVRACTAVVAEISYNSADIPYRAQIEFVQPSEWQSELRVLFQDLLDSECNVSKESANPDTDAGIARAKIQAVYPSKSIEDIERSSIEVLLQEVSQLLGQVRDVQDTKPARFYKRLRKLIDSQERNGEVKNGSSCKADETKRGVAYWPLIKVVRIYVKSPVLSTGLVLVDLPGIRDANPARAAIAEGYMKQCAGMWVVAPISRAVDDKTAQTLLGQSFKRQMSMDGSVGSLTFICSKTDDIDVTEAQESIDMHDRLLPLAKRNKELLSLSKSLDKELKRLKGADVVHNEAVEDLDDQIETWQELKDDAASGKEVFAPETEYSQIYETAEQDQPRKRQCLILEGDATTKEEDEDKNDSITSRPLKLHEITAKIAELRGKKKEVRMSKIETDTQVKGIRKKQDGIKAALKNVKTDTISACIIGRNDYAKATIRQDYAAGLKEFDLELAAEADENFKSGDDLRDYGKLADSIPVFCVSSRGYQKLKGRLWKDGNASAFPSIEETEIPMLQKHCIKITEAGRIANSHSFLNSLAQLLNSIALWASAGDGLTEEQKATRERCLAGSMEHLKCKLHVAIKTAADEILSELNTSIFDRYDSAVRSAADSAMETVHHWAKPINKENRLEGGFWWSTYQSFCRKEGVRVFKRQAYDWNDALAAPMVKKIIPGWEQFFNRRLPEVMVSLACRLSDLLCACHQDIDRDARSFLVGDDGLAMLQRQIQGYPAVFKSHTRTVETSIDRAQRDINRVFTQVIKNFLHPAYVACADEHGFKTFERMRNHMEEHVRDIRVNMFRASVDEVRRRILLLVEEETQVLTDSLEGTFHAVKRDYVSVLIGGNVPNAAELREARQELRREVIKIIDGSGPAFEEVANAPMKGERRNGLGA